MADLLKGVGRPGKAAVPAEGRQVPQPRLGAVSQGYEGHVAGQAVCLSAPSATFEFACYLEPKLAEGQGL